MEFGILHVGTSVSLLGLLGMVFYFAYWKGQTDIKVDHMKDSDGAIIAELKAIYSKLNQISAGVGKLETNHMNTTRRIARLEELANGKL